MCPACMASAALMVGSVSTGGIAALAVNMVRGTRKVQNENPKKGTERRNDDGNNDDNKQNRTDDGSAVR
jgi:hypothetical protein